VGELCFWVLFKTASTVCLVRAGKRAEILRQFGQLKREFASQHSSAANVIKSNAAEITARLSQQPWLNTVKPNALPILPIQPPSGRSQVPSSAVDISTHPGIASNDYANMSSKGRACLTDGSMC
jgi:hypothetical protein